MQEPKLADAYLQELYGALGNGRAFMKGKVVDVGALKDMLSRITARVLGEEKIHDVLLQVVQQHQLN